MKKIAIGIVITLVVVISAMSFYMITNAGGAKWVEDGWTDQEDSSGSSSSGDWGTEVEIEYEDGTNETLKTTLSSLKITHDGKNVSNFKYKLSARGDSNELSSCSIDLTGFWVDTVAKSNDGIMWDAVVEYGTLGDLTLDTEWHEVYTIIIEADDLASLADGEYTLEFTPSGSIYYRGSASSNWVELDGMPSSCWLTFKVDNFWIEIILEGGFN